MCKNYVTHIVPVPKYTTAGKVRRTSVKVDQEWRIRALIGRDSLKLSKLTSHLDLNVNKLQVVPMGANALRQRDLQWRQYPNCLNGLPYEQFLIFSHSLTNEENSDFKLSFFCTLITYWYNSIRLILSIMKLTREGIRFSFTIEFSMMNN